MFTFKVGDPVIFGRPGGEQTIGRVKAIGPKKYKIEQLETRGTKSPRPVGTIWTVPPALVQRYHGDLPTAVAVAPVVAPRPTPAPAAGSAFHKGDYVEFTHPSLGIIAGTVKLVNAKTVSLEDTSEGFGWRVPPSQLRRRDKNAPPPAAIQRNAIGVGVPVTYSGFTWGSGKVIEGPVVGVVTEVDVFRDEIEVFSGTDTRHIRRLQGNVKVEPVAKRGEDALRKEFAQVYAMLEPERLTADGERSRGEVAQLRSALNRALRALSQELGRTVSESEAYTASNTGRV